MRAGILAIFAGCILAAPVAVLAQDRPDRREDQTGCRQPDAVVLSAAQTRAQLREMFPISPPSLNRSSLKSAEKITSTILTFAIIADVDGNVNCMRTVSGHPIFVGPAMESIKNWKFRPPSVQGQPRSMYGMLVVLLSRTKDGIDTKVLDVEPANGELNQAPHFRPLDFDSAKIPPSHSND